LAREVADRLDADPALVARRIAATEKGGGRRAPAATASAATATASDGAEARPLSARERRERALLAMCVASPADGKEFIERLTPEHLSSPLTVRARDWLERNLEEPTRGLPRDEQELVSLVTQLVMWGEREPASREAMELNFLQLEQGMVERRIEAAAREGGAAPVELQRQRAELVERIARHEATG
jgi:hypothetical protein